MHYWCSVLLTLILILILILLSKFLDITVGNNSKGQQGFKVYCSNATANA